MGIYRKGIRVLDHIVNMLIGLCLLTILAYGIYSTWDNNQIYVQADPSQFETYRPAAKDNLSFAALKKINPEVLGWLRIRGTSVNYPLAQGPDNMKYINMNAEGEFSIAGSLFLDYRNHGDFSDVNSVVYGHNMAKDAMFGGLKKFEKKRFFRSHKCGRLYYGGEWHEVKFFAFLCESAYDPVIYDTELSGSQGGKRYLKYIEDRAIRFRTLRFRSGDRFLTLSTCTPDHTDNRHLLIGKIVQAPEAKASGGAGRDGAGDLQNQDRGGRFYNGNVSADARCYGDFGRFIFRSFARGYPTYSCKLRSLTYLTALMSHLPE